MMTGTWAKSIAGAMALAVLAGPASAGSLKDEPAPSDRIFAWSASFAVTNDYVFRGMSQTAKDPAVQATFEATYGILYGNVFVSNLDFGDTPIGDRGVATTELTFAAGIKPVLGPVNFDIGVIYYTYPGAHDSASYGLGELNFFEIKVAASVSPWKGGTVGVTGYWSPDYTGETGDVWTVEGSFAQELPKIRDIGVTFSALVGYQEGDSDAYFTAFGDEDSYVYWNAGVTLGFHERLSLDLRYWDTDLDFCESTRLLHCGARFVATAKATF